MSKHSNRTSTSISSKASKAERAAAIEAAMQAKAQEQATTEPTTAEQPATPTVEAPPVESPTTDSQAPQVEQPAQSGKKARILAPVDARAKLGVDRTEFRAKRGSGMELMLVLMSQPGGVTWDDLLSAQAKNNGGKPQSRSQTMGGIRWAAAKGWGVSGTVVPGALVLVDRDGNRVYYTVEAPKAPEQPATQEQPAQSE